MSSAMTFRGDINGLRAIAVLAVVTNHFWAAPAGGFVGVDIFFVISGFLITGQLVKMAEQDGRVSFSKFYRKRVRRIVPAATVTLLVTVGVGYLILRASAATSVAIDAFWSALSLGNWRFASAGTDYWAESDQASPLQHFWSLAVEEQYYVVWPILISVVTFFVVRAARHRLRVALIAVVSAVIMASFAWAVFETAQHEAFAYFNTFSRAWELGIGSLLALVPALGRMLRRPGRIALTWVGLLGLGIAVGMSYEGVPFPGPGAALAVLATAAVIIGGGHGDREPFILTNPLSKYVGEISFSLYLWHFPALVYTAVFIEAGSWQYFAVALGAAFLCAVVSYHLIESPIRRSTWLTDAGWRRPAFASVTSRIVLVAVVATLIAVPGWVASARQASATQALVTQIASEAAATRAATSATEGGSADEAAAPATALQSLAAEIAAATKATAWPETLTPSLETVATDGLPREQAAAGCEQTDVTDPESCRFGNLDSDKTMVVVGSSVGLALLPTVAAAYGDEYLIRGFTMIGCPMLDIETSDKDAQAQQACLEQRDATVQAINELKPAVILVTHSYSGIAGLVSGATGQAASAEWQAAAESFLTKTAPSESRVVFSPSAPAGKPVGTCATKFSSPEDCRFKVDAPYKLAQAAESAAAASSGGRARIIDTKGLFCTTANLCPAFVGDTLVKRDDVHGTPQYGAKIAPAFRELLDPELVP